MKNGCYFRMYNNISDSHKFKDKLHTCYEKCQICTNIKFVQNIMFEESCSSVLCPELFILLSSAQRQIASTESETDLNTCLYIVLFPAKRVHPRSYTPFICLNHSHGTPGLSERE